MTVDSELNRVEMYRAMVNKRNIWDTLAPSLLIAKDIENLEKERLKSIEFFDESKFTPVVLEDINTVRKIFNYNFKNIYYLFDFFEDTYGVDADIYKIDSLCCEMCEEITRNKEE